MDGDDLKRQRSKLTEGRARSTLRTYNCNLGSMVLGR